MVESSRSGRRMRGRRTRRHPSKTRVTRRLKRSIRSKTRVRRTKKKVKGGSMTDARAKNR